MASPWGDAESLAEAWAALEEKLVAAGAEPGSRSLLRSFFYYGAGFIVERTNRLHEMADEEDAHERCPICGAQNDPSPGVAALLEELERVREGMWDGHAD